MSVRIGETTSNPKSIHGGSPQGCVSANALFCATVESLQSGQNEEEESVNNYAMLRTEDEISRLPGDTILDDLDTENREYSLYTHAQTYGTVFDSSGTFMSEAQEHGQQRWSERMILSDEQGESFRPRGLATDNSCGHMWRILLLLAF